MKPVLPQVEAWTPAHPALAPLARAMGRQARRQDGFALQTGDNVGTTMVEKADTVVFAGAGAHTDPDFTRYFILLVAHAPRSRTTLLQTAPGRPRRNAHAHEPAPALTAKDVVPLVPGQVVILDAHQWHWVATPEAVVRNQPRWKDLPVTEYERKLAPHLTFCVTTESYRRPTREEAEARMVAYLAKKAPQLFAATVPGQSKPSRRAAP